MRASDPDFDFFNGGEPVPQLDVHLSNYLRAAKGALSPNTERALRADVHIFTTWCRDHALATMPARTATVVAFIEAMSLEKAPATVRRYVSSIATLYNAVREKNPAHSALVQLALQRMHRRNGRRQDQVHGLTLSLRNQLLEASGDRLIDARNRAILAVAYDALLRRSELVLLQISDVLVDVDGCATLLVRCSKTDTGGQGAMLYVARDSMKLVQEWVQRSGVKDGRLFRSVRKNGTVGERLDPSQVPRIYKAMAKQARLPTEVVNGLAGHSARVGAVQDMIASGVSMPAILQAGRWKSPAMVNRYGERTLAQQSGAAQLAEHQSR